MSFHKFSSPNKEKINGNKLNRPSRKNVQIFVEKDAVETSFENGQPGHFSRTLAKVRKQLLGFGTYTRMLMTSIVKLAL
jgi:hypothetical protein